MKSTFTLFYSDAKHNSQKEKAIFCKHHSKPEKLDDLDVILDTEGLLSPSESSLKIVLDHAVKSAERLNQLD